MARGFRVSLYAAALAGISQAWGFGLAPGAVGLRSSHAQASGLRRPPASVCQISAQAERPDGELRGVERVGQKVQTALVSGMLAAGLALSPAMEVLNSPLISTGGDAYAQGATSKKSTRGAPSVDANKDPESILRLSLPINDKNPIREAQAQLEMQMDKALREVKSDKWGKISSYNRKATSIFSGKTKEILKDVPAARQADAEALIASITQDLGNLGTTIEEKDVKKIEKEKKVLLNKIGELETLMVEKFPFEVPKEYASLPQLKGRAEVEMTFKKAEEGAKFDVDGTIYDSVTFRIVLDGYTAPITSGNFLNLINKGFYNGMAIQRSDGFVVQTGDPNPEEIKAPHGITKADGSTQTIPLEVFAIEDKTPTYEVTLEDDGRPLSQPKLPFSVYGTLGMARSEDDANDASSQWFFLLFDPELTTAGRNLMDGRFSTFGYVTQNNRLLSNIEVGDKIVSTKVISGLENLVNVK